MGELLTIGEVARLTGRRASALRYYEEIGLLPAATRVSGRRHHPPDVIRVLAVIETAQRAGLTLDEIKTLLHAGPGDHSAIEQLRAIAERKLPVLVAQIERATIVRAWLEAASRCECPDLEECPLFDAAGPLPARVTQSRSNVPGSGGQRPRGEGKGQQSRRTPARS